MKKKQKDGLLGCSRKCIEHRQEYGPMTLRQVAERVQLSFARIKQIETKALEKIKKRIGSFDSYF